MAKKRAVKKAVRPTRSRFVPPDNDLLTRTFTGAGMVPPHLAGTDTFLDIVTWNIRFFHDQDPDRVDRVVAILAALNADLFVFEEIKEGSLDVVAQKLSQRGAGHYSVAYGSTGGEQRVAFMWDLDWLRAKDDTTELFGRGNVRASDGKDAFPRLPLWGYFTGLREDVNQPPFDFQFVGLHLKSQRGGGEPQRIAAAEKLSGWLHLDAVQEDADVILMGDWNEPPDSDAWRAFRELEARNEAYFTRINNDSDISHFYYKNRNDLGSRLDLAAVSVAAYENMVNRDDGAVVVRWKNLDEFLSHHPSAQDIKRLISDLGKKISDHMPVITRFTWVEDD